MQIANRWIGCFTILLLVALPLSVHADQQPVGTTESKLDLQDDRSKFRAGKRSGSKCLTNNQQRRASSSRWPSSKPRQRSFHAPVLTNKSTSIPVGTDQQSEEQSVPAIKAPAPQLSLQASTNEVGPGESVILTWNSVSTENCKGAGSWRGALAGNGRKAVSDLSTNTTFSMTCESSRGRLFASTAVNVVSEPISEQPTPDQPLSGTALADEPPTSESTGQTPTAAVITQTDGGSSSAANETIAGGDQEVSKSLAPQVESINLVSGALYADQKVENCNTYDPKTRTCGAGSNRAFAKIQAGIDALSPGGTLYIMGGTNATDPDSVWNTGSYAGLDPKVRTTPEAPITISNYPGHSVIVQGVGARNGINLDNASHYTFRGMTVQNYQKSTEGFAAKRDITFEDMEFTDTKVNGMRLRNIDGLVLRNVHVHHTFESGISIRDSKNVLIENSSSNYNTDGKDQQSSDADGLHTISVDNLMVRNFIAEGNWEDGIDLHANATLINVISRDNGVVNVKLWRRDDDGYKPRHVDIYNAIVSGAAEAGIKMSKGVTANIRNSVIYANGEEGIAFRDPRLASDLSGVGISTVENSIIDDSGYEHIEVLGTSGNFRNRVIARNNIYRNSRSGATAGLESDTGSQTVDPMFVDPAAGDFRLQANSPAIDAGVETPYALDVNGVQRVQSSGWDVGVYEYLAL